MTRFGLATAAAMSSPRFGGRAWAWDGRILSASSFSGLLFLLLRPPSLSPRLSSRLGSEIFPACTFRQVKSTPDVALHGTPRFAFPRTFRLPESTHAQAWYLWHAYISHISSPYYKVYSIVKCLKSVKSSHMT